MDSESLTQADIPSLLTFYEAKLSLLLTISQSKIGAAHVMAAGLLHAIHVSGLFSVDPDIGVGKSGACYLLRSEETLLTGSEIDNPDALAKYYRLLLFITRIVACIVLVRGPQNTQSIDSGRSFLQDNRALVVAVYKRQAKLGGVSFDDAGINIEELANLFTLLVAMTNFVEVGENPFWLLYLNG